MTVQTNHHIVITDAEQQTIVNALLFYNTHHSFPLYEWPEGEQAQWRLVFMEDNRGRDCKGPVDQLATKIATSK